MNGRCFQALQSKGRTRVQSLPKLFDQATGPRWLIILFLVAFAVRAVNLMAFPDGTDWYLVPDSAIYLELRDNLLETGHYVRQDGAGGYAPEIERVPGYPLFLAGLHTLGLESPAAIVWVQAAVDAATVVLIALLGSVAAPQIGAMAGLLAAFWPNMAITGTLVLNDTLYLFLLTASLLCFAHYLRAPGLRLAVVGGLLFGLSLMVRPVFQFLPPILAIVAFAAAYRAGNRVLMSGGMAAALLVACLLPPAPIMHRNLTQFDTVSLTAQGGTHLLGWVLPLVRWHSQGTPYDDAFLEVRAGYDRYLEERNIDPATLGSFAASQLKSSYVLQELGSEPPLDIAEAWIKGAMLNMMAPAVSADPRLRAARTGSLLDDDGAGWTGRLIRWANTTSPLATAILLLGLAGSALVSLLQLAGLVTLWSRARWGVVFGVLLAAYILAIMGPVVGAKYRLPFVMVEILFTAAGITAVLDRFRKKAATA